MLPVGEVAAVEFVAGKGQGGPEQDEGRQDGLHATSTRVFIPDA